MNLFKSILELLSSGESFVLATILSRSGSAPRAAGTRMVVRSDSSILGTVGGGILEAKVQELAKEVLDHRRSLVEKFDLSAADAGRMGMICGGRQEVLIHFVDGKNPANLELYREFVQAMESQKPAWLLTKIPSGKPGGDDPVQYLIGKSGMYHGLKSEEARVRGIAALAVSREPELVYDNGERFLVEPLCQGGTVYIFGAGHISQKLAHLTSLVGFRTVVLDDRREFADRARFETADLIVVLDSFENALKALDPNQESYIVLVTRGHAHDRALLAEALETKARYIGMIGSRRKRDAVFESLLAQGFPKEAFDRVNSPIGLDIGAETVEEIAVSIVAELIQVRAGKNR